MKWNAWGDPAEAKPLSDGIRSLLKQALGRRGVRRPPNSSRSRCGCGRPRCRTPTARAWRPIVGAEYCGVDDRGRLLRAGGKSTLDLLRRKDSGVQDAPDAVLLPARRGRDRRDPAVLRGPRASPSSRSAAAPAWSAALDPIRGDFKAVVSLDLRRLDRTARPRRGLRRSRTGRGPDRPGGRTAARRARLLARPLPAELPVRHHRRVRGDAVVRPGLRGLRPLQRHGPRAARGDPGGRARPRAVRRSRRPGRICGS